MSFNTNTTRNANDPTSPYRTDPAAPPMMVTARRDQHDSSTEAGRERSDAAIVAESVTDPVVFAVLFDRYWSPLRAFCMSRAGSLGEDLAAEAFRVAFDQRDRFDTQRVSARPWLYGIAVNLIRNHFRSVERGRRARARSIDTAETSDGVDDLLTRVEAEQLGPNLAAAIGALPAKDRDALLLLAWTDFRYEDIAEALNIPIGTVRSRIHRARARVQDHLTANEDPR